MLFETKEQILSELFKGESVHILQEPEHIRADSASKSLNLLFNDETPWEIPIKLHNFLKDESQILGPGHLNSLDSQIITDAKKAKDEQIAEFLKGQY